MKKQASKKTPTSVGAECCTGPDLECRLAGPRQRRRKVMPKGEVVWPTLSEAIHGPSKFPWCQHSGCNPSLSPELCVGFQSCLLRFVNSPKSWFQRLGVGSLGKMAPRQSSEYLRWQSESTTKEAGRVGGGWAPGRRGRGCAPESTGRADRCSLYHQHEGCTHSGRLCLVNVFPHWRQNRLLLVGGLTSVSSSKMFNPHGFKFPSCKNRQGWAVMRYFVYIRHW